MFILSLARTPLNVSIQTILLNLEYKFYPSINKLRYLRKKNKMKIEELHFLVTIQVIFLNYLKDFF